MLPNLPQNIRYDFEFAFFRIYALCLEILLQAFVYRIHCQNVPEKKLEYEKLVELLGAHRKNLQLTISVCGVHAREMMAEFEDADTERRLGFVARHGEQVTVCCKGAEISLVDFENTDGLVCIFHDPHRITILLLKPDDDGSWVSLPVISDLVM